MSLTVVQILDMIAPQFVADTNKLSFIELATMRTNANVFGENYNLAVALRSAHMLTLSKRASGDAGQVSSKREGDLQISYFQDSSASSTDNGDLGMSHYGKQLIGLINGVIPAVGVTGGNDNGYEDTGAWNEEEGSL